MTAISSIFAFHRLQIGGWLTTLLIFGIVMVALYWGLTFPHNEIAHDFLINYHGVQSMSAGRPLYNAEPELFFYHFISTPFVAVLIWPFTALPAEAAVGVYRAVELLWFLAGSILLAHTVGGSSIILRLLIVLPALIWQPARDGIMLGQIDGITFFFLVLAYVGHQKKLPQLMGIGIGLAGAIKGAPLLLAGWLLLHRDWRSLRWTIGTFGAVMMIGLLSVGWQNFWAFLTHIAPMLGNGSPCGFSLPSLVGRMLEPQDTWCALNAFGGRWQVKAFSLVLGCAFTWLLYRAIRDRRDSYGLALTMILLWIPFAWWHYATWLLIPVVELISRRSKALLVAVILINFSPYYTLAISYMVNSPLWALAWSSINLVGVVVLLWVQLRPHKFTIVE